MANWCVFCGQPIEDGKLYCDQCDGIVQDLTPEQRKAFEELIKDEKDRENLRAAINNIMEQITQIVESAVRVINEIIYGRNDDGQQG